MITDNIILKLNSGEEVVCKITDSSDSGTYTIENPLLLNSTPRVTRNGVEESISFRRWIHFSEASVFEINRNNVMLKTDASIGLSKFYEVCVLQLNNNFEEEDVWMEATDEELDTIEMEEVMEQFSTDMSDTIH